MKSLVKSICTRFLRKDNDLSKSFALKTLNCSFMRETLANDPRGYDVAYKEAKSKIMDPVHDYLKKHPKEKLTAKLIDDIYYSKK